MSETILKLNEYYLLVDPKTNLRKIVYYYKDFKTNFTGFGFINERGVDFVPKFDIIDDVEIYELDYKRGNKVTNH